MKLVALADRPLGVPRGGYRPCYSCLYLNGPLVSFFPLLKSSLVSSPVLSLSPLSGYIPAPGLSRPWDVWFPRGRPLGWRPAFMVAPFLLRLFSFSFFSFCSSCTVCVCNVFAYVLCLASSYPAAPLSFSLASVLPATRRPLACPPRCRASCTSLERLLLSALSPSPSSLLWVPPPSSINSLFIFSFSSMSISFFSF